VPLRTLEVYKRKHLSFLLGCKVVDNPIKQNKKLEESVFFFFNEYVLLKAGSPKYTGGIQEKTPN
jgi:hypothetical protein